MARMVTQTPFAGREFGILLHPSSLFGREDIGTLGAEAYQFVDWLASTGAGIWQILPLTLNGQYDSPYFSYSAFAGNPWLVDLSHLHGAGLLPQPMLHEDATDARVSFAELVRTKRTQLLEAAEALLADDGHPWRERLEQFRTEEFWLADTAHFFALKEEFDDAPWWQWPESLRTRDAAALSASRQQLAERIAVWEALFFFFDLQWSSLKAHANLKGLRVLGDLPIYVNHDSADVWLNQEQFRLDRDGAFLAQSGVGEERAVAVQPELFLVEPDIGGIVIEVDRQVPQHAQALEIRVRLQRGPLQVEEEEQRLPHGDAFGQLLPRCAQRRGIAGTQRFRPLPPRGVVELLLQREKVRRVGEPEFLGPELFQPFAPGMAVVGEQRLGRLQQLWAFRAHQFGERHPCVGGVLVQHWLRQQARAVQVAEVDEPRIAGERGIAEVRGVVLPVQGERQDLPDTGTGAGQPVDELVRLGAEGADVLATVQAGGVQQDAELPAREGRLGDHARHPRRSGPTPQG